MKILWNSDMEKIKERAEKFEFDKIVLDSGKADKDLAINHLVEQLSYLYAKLGVTK